MTELLDGEYYYIEAYDHELIVANQEDSDDDLIIRFIARLEKQDPRKYFFNLVEYKKEGQEPFRADQIKIVKGTISTSYMFDKEFIEGLMHN